MAEGYAEWWGAVGDGKSDNAGAINAALSALPRVRLLDGTYAVGSTVTREATTELVGAGIFQTKLLYTGPGSEAVFNPGAATAHFDGFQIDGQGVAGTVGILCDSNRPYRAKWGRYYVVNCPAVGLRISPSSGGVPYNDFGTGWFNRCGAGVEINPTNTGWVNANKGTFFIQQCKSVGFELHTQGRGANGNEFFVEAENCDIGVDMVRGRGNRLSGWLESNATWELRIADRPDVLDFVWAGPIEDLKKVHYNHSDERSVQVLDNQRHYYGGRLLGGLDSGGERKQAVLEGFTLRNSGPS